MSYFDEFSARPLEGCVTNISIVPLNIGLLKIVFYFRIKSFERFAKVFNSIRVFGFLQIKIATFHKCFWLEILLILYEYIFAKIKHLEIAKARLLFARISLNGIRRGQRITRQKTEHLKTKEINIFTQKILSNQRNNFLN